MDLVYLDPPFKSNQDYNMLYRERDGSRSAAQERAFTDTWTWDPKAAKAYRQTVEAGGPVADAMDAFRRVIASEGGTKQQRRAEMLAYLSMMAPRLVELHRVLKPSGWLYLHCDPTASHYLKVLLDAVFGAANFRNEITWKRTSAHGDASTRFASVHDTILAYGKSKGVTWHQSFGPYSEEYVKEHFVHSDPDGRLFRRVDLRSPHPRPNLTYDYLASNGRVYKPHRNGWAVSLDTMRELDKAGKLFFPAKPNGRLRRKIYLDESPGVLVSDVWTDLRPIHASADERIGYPTQKPVALLKRIIEASTNEGDMVLDPFCGCGSTIEAAEDCHRKWIGIDITHLAIEVIEARLKKRGLVEGKDYIEDCRFAPRTLPDVEAMARKNKHAFQGWALQQAGIEPFQLKPGPDRGIDGRKVFFDPAGSNERREIIVSVKGGNLPATCIRDLIGTVQRERAHIGVLITLKKPTRNMGRDAAEAPPYRGADGRIYPGIQVLTVRDLLDGHTLEYPLQLIATKEPIVPPIARAFELEAQPIARRMAKATLPLGFRREKAHSRMRRR